MKTNQAITQMDKQAELKRRKAELKAQIETQQAEIKQTIQDIRAELEPSKLLKRAVGGALDITPKGENAPLFPKLPPPLSLALDLLVRDSRWAMGLKLIAPVAMKMLPALLRRSEKPKTPELEAPKEEEAPQTPLKVRASRQLRNAISAIRKSIRKKDDDQPEQYPVEFNPE